MKIRVVLNCLLFICSTLTLGAQAIAETPFSANDLAILFPMDAQGQTLKQVITLDNKEWPVLSAANFKAVLSAASKNGIFLNEKFKNPQTWQLVAFRYSPCIYFAGKDLPCSEQIRFVFQPFKVTREGFEDYAMHVVFKYGDRAMVEKTSRLESFLALKNQFGSRLLNKTLKPNALLASDLGAQYLKAIQQEIIQKHVGNRSASLVTFMGLGKLDNKNEENAHDWRFFAGDVDANGNWQLGNLPTGHDIAVERFHIDDEEGMMHFNIKPLPGQPNMIGKDDQTALREEAFKIFDTRQTNDHNVDCASCHIADAFAFPIMYEQEPEQKNQFMAQLQAMMDTTARTTEIVINQDLQVGRLASEAVIPRLFGYLDNMPLIGQRMVWDNSIAVAQANFLLGVNGAPQCGKESQKKAFIECLYMVKGNNVSQCLQKACQ